MGGIIAWPKDSDPSTSSNIWLECNGQTFDTRRFPKLYKALGSNTVPDLRDRFIVSTGSKYKAGDTGGLDEVKLSIDEMPSHTHSGSTDRSGNHKHSWQVAKERVCGDQKNEAVVGDSWSDGANEMHTTGNDGEHVHSLNINNTGGGKGHENRPPYYAMRFYIRAK